MVSKSFIAYAFLLCFTTSVNAHAAIAPALGVKGNPTRSDVQNPSSAKPCGNVNIAQSIDTSTPVTVAANGTFSPSIANFNPGADGSRSIKTVQVDASGTGKNFIAAKMIVNGDANPTNTGTQQLTVQLPAGTTCTGGTGKNLCLTSFTTTAGFGNCVVVSQGAKGAVPPTSTKTGQGAASACPTGAAKGRPSSSPPAQPSVQPAAASNQTDTTTGDKKRHSRRAADAGAANVNLRSGSFRRNWSSRESIDLS